MNKEELKIVIQEHEKQTDSGYKDGSCADLSGTDLRNADLRDADLGGTNPLCANLTGAIMPKGFGKAIKPQNSIVS